MHVRAVPAQNIYPFTNHLAMQALLLPIIFFNGNCSIPDNLPWEERVNLFCRGYEEAKAEGDRQGLQVFLLGKTALTATNFWCMDWISSG